MRSILIVDDEQSMCDFLSILLENEGYDVKSTTSARESLQMIQESDPTDMIISDIMMPEINGIELLREVKKFDPQIIVIMITAFATTENAIEAMKLGAYDYLQKPADFEDLTGKLAGASRKKADQDERIRQAEARELLRKGGNI